VVKHDQNLNIIDGKMLFFRKISPFSEEIDKLKKARKSVGFVPTMGALHAGHISLAERARSECEVVVTSIFVNPTQFNNPEDLKNYPRMPEQDKSMLEACGVDLLFSPDADEIYGNDSRPPVEGFALGKIAEVMEGAHRPGHFAGVVQIVSRLFEIVRPDRAYFGEKDFQQLAVIRYMTQALKFPVEIIACPTIREENGLAMSSRNLRLSPEGRVHAAVIYRSISQAAHRWKDHAPGELKNTMVREMESVPGLRVEYVELADEDDLQPVLDWKSHRHVRCFAAVFCEGVRLIDNVRVF
jgi:pantoate--beta-alanine ligase